MPVDVNEQVQGSRSSRQLILGWRWDSSQRNNPHPAELTGHSYLFGERAAYIRVGEGTWPDFVPFKFSGKISKVTIELKPMAAANRDGSGQACR